MTAPFPARPWRDPAFVPAMRLSWGLWTFGYAMLAGLTVIGDRFRGVATLALLVLQYATALPIAAGLLCVVLLTTGRRLRPLTIAGALLAAVALQGAVEFFTNWAFEATLIPREQERAPADLVGYVRSAFPFLWVYGLNLVLILLTVANVRVRDQQRELAEARAAAAQAQLAMLRYQLNPHFLFNTLNAISSLVVTGRPAAAEEMLGKLSTFLRASLASDAGDFVTLDAELGMIQEYLDIESVRFGDRLAVDFACQPEATTMLVPSLILQPLAENAVKYAVGPALRPVTIKVDARLDGADLVVMVCDDGEGIQTDTRGGTGVGLKNVRGRLQALYGARGSLEAVPLERGFMAIVRLPARPAPGGGATIVPFRAAA